MVLRISVIIPVYNVERFLERCLDSVLAAARGLDVEIICVNDGSTDGSARILEGYADRVKVITQENRGQGPARNVGLDVMTGDYVMFVDSDDWIPEWAIRRFSDVARDSGAGLVVSMSFAVDRAPVPGKGSWKMRPAAWMAGRKVQYSTCNRLYRADLFRTRRYPATVYEDFPVATGVLCEVGEFAAIDEPLYIYCRNEAAVSTVRSSFSERKLRDSISVVRMVLEMACRQSDPRLARFALRQAADAHSSTIGQVSKSQNAELSSLFMGLHAGLVADYPELVRKLTLKARLRLWWLGRKS